MKFVLAPDSFKESMTASVAAAAMSAGVRDVFPEAECIEVPMSDGGEGFARAVAASWGAEWIEIPTEDALGRPISAAYALAADGRAVMDMASTAGLELIREEDRNVALSTTAGLGVMLRDALSRGATEVLIGIGGSATNDAGAGMLRELGVRFLDADGTELGATLSDLAGVATVDSSHLDPRLSSVRILVACDVANPLHGPRGATAVFGPQKGVRPQELGEFDATLRRFAVASGHAGVAHVAGAGAAGGLGFALLAFLKARLHPGVVLVSEAVDLDEKLEGAALVLTGEGAVDSQTLEGKTPAGVAAVAQRRGVRTWLFAGRVKPGAENLLQHGVERLVPIVEEDVPMDRALAEGRANLRRAVAEELRKSRT